MEAIHGHALFCTPGVQDIFFTYDAGANELIEIHEKAIASTTATSRCASIRTPTTFVGTRTLNLAPKRPRAGPGRDLPALDADRPILGMVRAPLSGRVEDSARPRSLDSATTSAGLVIEAHRGEVPTGEGDFIGTIRTVEIEHHPARLNLVVPPPFSRQYYLQRFSGPATGGETRRLVTMPVQPKPATRRCGRDRPK